jgi:hypothetical protein
MYRTGENDYLLETILGAGEVVADVYEVGGEAFSSIPVVGTMIQLARAANSIRDRTLAARLTRFLEPFAEASQEYRDKFKERLMQDKDETRRIGKTLLLVIDRLTDPDKAKILGYLLVAFLNDQLTSIEMALEELLACAEPIVVRSATMSKPFKKISIKMPTLEKDKLITQAAVNDQDALPLTDEQMNEIVPLRSLRSRPRLAIKSSLSRFDIVQKCWSFSDHQALAGNHVWMLY